MALICTLSRDFHQLTMKTRAGISLPQVGSVSPVLACSLSSGRSESAVTATDGSLTRHRFSDAVWVRIQSILGLPNGVFSAFVRMLGCHGNGLVMKLTTVALICFVI